MATPIGRLAAAMGDEAKGLSVEGLVDLVIQKLGLASESNKNTAEGTAEGTVAEEAPDAPQTSGG